MLSSNRLNQIFAPFPSDPWQTLANLSDELFRQWDLRQPPFDRDGSVRLWTSHDAVLMEIDLPGRNPDQIDVALEGKLLEVKAPAVARPAGNLVQSERMQTDFAGKWQFPFVPHEESTEVSYDEGILRILLRRAPAPERRKLSINTR